MEVIYLDFNKVPHAMLVKKHRAHREVGKTCFMYWNFFIWPIKKLVEINPIIVFTV